MATPDAKKPDAKKTDVKPDAKKTDVKPDAKKTDVKPDVKPDAKKTDVKPDVKPGAKPDAKKTDVKPDVKPGAKPDAKKTDESTNVIAALMRYVQSSNKNKKKKDDDDDDDDKDAEKSDKSVMNDISPEALLDMKKIDHAKELLKIISDIYGSESPEYKQVEKYVLNASKEKRFNLNDIIEGVEKKRDTETKEKVIKLLDDFDKFLEELEKGDAYTRLLESEGKKAKQRLLGFLNSASAKISGFSNNPSGGEIIPMIIKIAESIGINALELFMFLAKHGIDISRLIHTPIRYSITNNRPRRILRSLENRVKSRLYNLKNMNKIDQKGIYDEGFKDAKNILKNLYQEGYKDAIQSRRRRTNKGGKKSRRTKKGGKKSRRTKKGRKKSRRTKKGGKKSRRTRK